KIDDRSAGTSVYNEIKSLLPDITDNRAISSLKDIQIQNIINRFPKKNAHMIEPFISNDSEKLPETEVSAFLEKVSLEIQVNTSNKAYPPISILPNCVIFFDNDVGAGYYYDLSSGRVFSN
ncbi:13413_t:CDS:2, partial [Entrophospora sp. SA101]